MMTILTSTKRKKLPFSIISLICLLATNIQIHASEFVPEIAYTETLSSHKNQDWFWVSGMRAPNFTDGRAFLFGSKGEVLGQLSTGFWFNSLVTPNSREEILTVETYFSRGTRGERTDVVTRYDARTLSPSSEIIIPPKRMNSVKNTGLSTLSEDEKLLLVVNYTPAQSLSVINLETNQFIEEIETPGCSVLYSAGNRDFYSICGNGGFMHIQLDEEGRLKNLNRSEILFDPVKDFLTIAASRIGDVWYFVSRQNNVYAIEMKADQIKLLKRWSLLSESERDNDWLISGMHHTATHSDNQELYVIMHQGTPETFEQPGTHVWVYDVNTGKKLREIEMEDMTISIAVTQDNKPKLLALDAYVPMNILFTAWTYLTEGEAEIIRLLKQRVNIYDGASGDHLNQTGPLPAGFVYNIQTW